MEQRKITRPITIFVDTDAFVALIKKNDSNHAKAKNIFEKLQSIPIEFTTSNYVFSETITILSQKVNHATAIRYIDAMLSSENVFDIRRVDETIEDLAISIFKDQTSKNISFVDCANMAVIRELGLDGIFSFDRAYITNKLSLAETFI